MRSVFVHLWDTTEGEVVAVLDRLYPGQQHPWVSWVNGSPRLYINFYHDGPAEDDDWEGCFASCGGPPDVSLIADISGRHDGWPEVRDFVSRLLGAFQGVATDDAWLHLWSREDVEHDRVVAGQRFGEWRNSRATPAGQEDE